MLSDTDSVRKGLQRLLLVFKVFFKSFKFILNYYDI